MNKIALGLLANNSCSVRMVTMFIGILTTSVDAIPGERGYITGI